MAPTGEGDSAPGTKGKGKTRTKSVRHLLALPAAPAAAPAATASPAARSRSKRPTSQSISSSETCESPTTAASEEASVIGSSAPNVNTSCSGSGAGAPATTTTPINVDDDEDDKDEEQAHLSGKRFKKCTSSVWKYFTKKKEVLEVDGKQFEQLWGYCNFPNYKQRYRAEGVCGMTAFKNHLKSKHSIVEGQQQLKVDSKMVGSIMSDLEVEALANVVAKLKIEADNMPFEIVQSYEKNGAACLSILTDEKHFQGSFENLETVRNAGVKCPLLCKEFVIDIWQIYYARSKGVDAFLLIAAVLPDLDIKYMLRICKNLGMTALIEVHGERELDHVLKIDDVELIGINNRSLETFKVDTSNTKILLEKRGDIIRDKEILLCNNKTFDNSAGKMDETKHRKLVLASPAGSTKMMAGILLASLKNTITQNLIMMANKRQEPSCHRRCCLGQLLPCLPSRSHAT
ncbi:hypothetical protein E2562_036603 [Oryza meyeriana var. granulata]|uniref:indole-3-glycerol-phosphate synthase n=1 Tax=Oryza meyeriana var. granulata TaxID=110450 RepID=A0A6G1DAR9_9ORYZ|nr:hypothetical protein E2562_036603 [Oryza meyeriana var. granulata]